MTTTLAPEKAKSTFVGRRIRDCEDGTIHTILGVDDDGDFIIYYTDNGVPVYAGWYEMHHEGESHMCWCVFWGVIPCPDCRDGRCFDCYTWVKEGT